MIDLIAHLTRQAAFSRATFGPGPRTEGVLGHISKEAEEVRKCYAETTRLVNDGHYHDPVNHKTVPRFRHVPVEPCSQHDEASAEWVDMVILSLDGLLRAISAANPDWTLDRVARAAAEKIVEKQGKNERRDWPDWRGQSADRAIEHRRGHED